MTKKYLFSLIACLPLLLFCQGCPEPSRPTSDDIQQQQQEQMLKDASSSLGMPNIKNFREKRTLKMIQERRDQEGYLTYTYMFSQFTGKFTCIGVSVGFPIPYATQYTNPMKIERSQVNVGIAVLPQADPNGLFSPASADATWSLMKDPAGKDIGPAYQEDKIDTYPFRLRPAIVAYDCDDKMVEDAKAAAANAKK